MNTDDTGNAQKLPLVERARRGLLALESELPLEELLKLEWPSNNNPESRKKLESEIRTAIHFGDLKARLDIDEHTLSKVEQAKAQEIRQSGDMRALAFYLLSLPGDALPQDWLIDRESYHTWRARCPHELLSPLSQIRKWLGATPAIESIPPAEPSLSEPTAPAVLPEPVGNSGSVNPVHRRQRVTDKADFIKSATWCGNQTNTVNQHPQVARFRVAYDDACLLKWASELDPRPDDRRGGRPRKKK